MHVVPFKPSSPIASDTSAVLRELADAVDCGDVTELIVCCIDRGEYSFKLFSSLTESLVLANLYLQWILHKFEG